MNLQANASRTKRQTDSSKSGNRRPVELIERETQTVAAAGGVSGGVLGDRR